MLDYLINLATRLGHWGYLIIFFVSCAETAFFLGFLVPGETLVIVCGFLARQGVFELDGLIATVATGSALGDTIGYMLGRRFGRDWLLRHGHRFGLRPQHWDRVNAYFERHGAKTVLIARFVGFLRALVPFTAGTSGMDYWRFFRFNIAGAILWASACVLLGYCLGASWQVAEKWIGRASGILVGTLAVALLLYWLWRWVVRHETELKARWHRLREHPRIAMLRKRFASQLAFLQKRFSPEGYLGLHVTVGALVMIAGSWVFGEIARSLSKGGLLAQIDVQLAAWLHSHTTPVLTQILLAVSFLHRPVTLTIISAIFAAFLLWQKRYYLLTELVLAMGGGLLLNVLLKEAFRRSRPWFENPILTLHGYSFPSGHTMAATLFYGMLVTWIFSVVPSWRGRTLTVFVAFFLILIVGFSRMYLGVHYLSDVLAAAAAGVTWLAICISGVETLRRYQAKTEV